MAEKKTESISQKCDKLKWKVPDIGLKYGNSLSLHLMNDSLETI